MPLFKLIEIDLKEIDLNDLRFKISSNTDVEDLVQSIKKYGLLQLPLLLKKNKGYSVISGFRRITACLKSGIYTCFAMVADTEDLFICTKIAILDNVNQRHLDIIEQIRSVKLIRNFFLDSENSNEFYKMACEVLKINQNRSYIEKLMIISQLPEPILNLISTEHISITAAIELSYFDKDSLPQFIDFFSSFKISLNKQKEFILLIREIAFKEKVKHVELMNDVLELCKCNSGLEDKNSLFNLIRSYLNKRRFPEISGVYDRYHSLVSKLKISDGLKLVPPDNFEGSIYQLHIFFKNLEELTHLNQRVGVLCLQPEMEMILKRT